MRTQLKIFAVIAFFTLGLSAAVLAQPGGGWNSDPEQRATQQTVAMTAQLSLSDAQSAKVKEINLKYANKMKEAREKATGDRDAMRATMTTIRQEQDKELQTVMTEEQWQQWVKYRDEQRANRGNFGPDNKQPGPPPDDNTNNKKGKKSKNKKQRSTDSTDGQ